MDKGIAFIIFPLKDNYFKVIFLFVEDDVHGVGYLPEVLCLIRAANPNN